MTSTTSQALTAGWKAWNFGERNAVALYWSTEYNRLLGDLDLPARASVERRVREKIKYYGSRETAQ